MAEETQGQVIGHAMHLFERISRDMDGDYPYQIEIVQRDMDNLVDIGLLRSRVGYSDDGRVFWDVLATAKGKRLWSKVRKLEETRRMIALCREGVALFKRYKKVA